MGAFPNLGLKIIQIFCSVLTWPGIYQGHDEPNFDIEGGREAFEQVLGENMKAYMKSMEIISIGQPTNSFASNMWFVPYTIRFKDGNQKSMRLHLAQDTRTQRWILKGGF